jgi:hypothetical protein
MNCRSPVSASNSGLTGADNVANHTQRPNRRRIFRKRTSFRAPDSKRPLRRGAFCL